jgi:MOSC domain-containing protein YiiM
MSPEKHTKKKSVPRGVLVTDHGLEGDAHAGSGREVSLLALDAIDRMREKMPELEMGDFAENLTVSGLPMQTVAVGSRLILDGGAVLEVTNIGKKCHHKCEIMRKVGTCVMPKEGIFARVVTGGPVRAGDAIRIE